MQVIIGGYIKRKGWGLSVNRSRSVATPECRESMEIVVEESSEVVDGDALLLHGVAVADGDTVVVEGVVVHGDAEGGADGILTAIAATDGVLLVVLEHVVGFEHVHNLAGFLGQSVLLDQRQHSGLVGSQHGGQAEDRADTAVGKGLVLQGMAEDGQESAVDTDGGLDDVGRVALVELGVEILEFLAAELAVTAEVEVGAAVDTFQLLESEGKLELDVGGSVGVVGQLLVVVVAVLLGGDAHGEMPFEAFLLPVAEPLHLGAGTDEELHLHLLEFAHTEDELAGDNLVAEGFAYLGDAEGNLHAAGLLDVEEVDKDALCRLGTEIEGVAVVDDGAHLGGEHEVELAHVGPVAGAADGTDDAEVEDELLETGKVVGVHQLGILGVDFVNLFLVFQHTGVGGDKLLAVEGVAKAFVRLLALFVYLLLNLGDMVLDEDVGAIAFLGVFVVDQRVVEGIHMAGGFPDARVHEDGGVDTDDVLVVLHHGTPPVLLDVVFEFGSQLAIVVHGGETVVYLAGGEYEAVFLGVGYYLFEEFFLICHILDI